MGLLPEGLAATGSVRLAGVDHDLVGAGDAALSRVRGRDVAMVFQEPMTALNPTMRVGRAGGRGDADPRDRARPEAPRSSAPWSCSPRSGCPSRPRRPAPTRTSSPAASGSGSCSRMALANDPALLICDEPTTALDVTVQARVLDLIVRGVEARHAALLFITHDLAVVATACERVLVMYGGRIVEAGPVREVFTRPRHRYTQGLVAASDLTGDGRRRLVTIPGRCRRPASSRAAACSATGAPSPPTSAPCARPGRVPTRPGGMRATTRPTRPTRPPRFVLWTHPTKGRSRARTEGRETRPVSR